MKQVLLRLLYKYVINKIHCYTEHSLEVFEKESKLIINAIKSISPQIEIGKPFKVSNGGPEYHWRQTVITHLGPGQHIAFSWSLEDCDSDPYAVLDMTKYVRFNGCTSEGIGQIGVTAIFPEYFHRIPRYFQILKDYKSHFTHYESTTVPFTPAPNPYSFNRRRTTIDR